MRISMLTLSKYFKPPPLYSGLQVGSIGLRLIAIDDDIGCSVRVIGHHLHKQCRGGTDLNRWFKLYSLNTFLLPLFCEVLEYLHFLISIFVIIYIIY